jgi:hypothetical protein
MPGVGRPWFECPLCCRDIALRLADRYDPFYQPEFEEKFNRLRRNILKMEEEAEAERA